TGAEYRTVPAAPDALPHFVLPTGDEQRGTAAAVAEVAAALPRAVARQVRSMDALDPTAITLVLTHDRLVRWGTAERSAEKAQLLPALLRHAVSVVKLTDPDQPYT